MRTGDTGFVNPGSDRVEIYRVSKWVKIPTTTVLLSLACLGVMFVVKFFQEGRFTEIRLVAACLILGAAFGALFFYTCLSVFKSRIEIYSDRIRSVGSFKTKEVLINQISGFRILRTGYGQKLLLMSKDPASRNIKIDLAFERQSDLLEWVNRNFANLDATDLVKEIEQVLQQVLQDTNLGDTKEQRVYVLQRARRWAKILNGLSILVTLWAFFKPYPYGYVIWTLILLPLLACVSLRHFKGALKFDAGLRVVFPDTDLTFSLPPAVLVFRAFIDWNILAWNNFWAPFAAVSLSFYCLILWSAKDVKNKKGTKNKVANTILLAVTCMLYAFGAVISLNGILDSSAPSTYKARVVDKGGSNGRHMSYYLRLSPWEPEETDREVGVRKSVYEKYKAGDDAVVVVRNGKLGIPWYFVR